jgi:hypothetical protein
LSTVILVGLFAGITSSKYENYINVFLYFILFLLSITLLNYLKKILHNRIKYKL